ncbi:MAG: ABC transporter ATP-binding protein/permease, partial [Clostridia bacterium]|nr:ABC transporter ATP-binding protein/permease [Clostridia bacterium]
DRYNSGDLIISGRSTKGYKDSDWDTYRNHTIGFVFQNYNLIPHQSVLTNVELALTLTGVPKSVRKEKAKLVLKKVGLGDQLNKKPNQMSGGQMQRVAIARALVNDPEILLADEPTGALDSETSVQIMELLKEISNDRLVIMVTHNPEIAEKYSTRILNLFDGKIINDSNPYTDDTKASSNNKKQKKPSMSFFTALSLSCKNLLTKKARTFLTSFAGSIGIIGIALILSLSNGVDLYINNVEKETLTNYPIEIEKSTIDSSELMQKLMEGHEIENPKDKTLYSNDVMRQMMAAMINGSTSNDLASFKKYIEQNKDELEKYTSDIKYTYTTEMNIYTSDGYRVNPSLVMETLGFDTETQTPMGNVSMMGDMQVWTELLDNDELLDKQYDVIAGRMPQNYDEIVVIVDENNQISDYTLYTLGLKDSKELTDIMKAAMNGEKVEDPVQTEYSYDDILDLSFRLMVNSDYYQKNESGIWTDMSEDTLYMLEKLKNSAEVKVVGILRSTSNFEYGTVGYLNSLTKYLINQVNDSEIVKEQKANPELDILTGLPFPNDEDFTMEELNAYIATLPTEQQIQFNGYIAQMKQQGIKDEKIVEQFSSYLNTGYSTSSYEENLLILGVSDLESPNSILIYPSDFEAKDKLSEFIAKYNEKNAEDKQIGYTDYIGLMMSSVTTIINAISYILIAFVSISLIVSSIMIGIITYISVLERTKEIGILRAIGASKHDISRVFNAETLIVGFVAGIIGIGITLLLLIPINAIIFSITEISGIAVLPISSAVSLVIISMLLTFIAGLFPSKIAARKEPVTALRSE